MQEAIIHSDSPLLLQTRKRSLKLDLFEVSQTTPLIVVHGIAKFISHTPSLMRIQIDLTLRTSNQSINRQHEVVEVGWRIPVELPESPAQTSEHVGLK